MTIGLYVLLSLILVLLVALSIVYFLNFKKSQEKLEDKNTEDHTAILQKDLQNSKEVLANQIEYLQKALQQQIIDSKEMIAKNIETLKDTSNRNDLTFNQNLTQLNEKIKGLKSDLSKQDTDLKSDLNIQKDNINKSFSNVIQNLTVLTESTKSLKEVEDKVKSLNNVFLNSNKTRGNLGEYVLEKLLSDLYGETHELWEKQHKLPDGNIVDAIIKTGDNKENIAVDSKFPLTNYNNYVKAEDKIVKDDFLKKFKRDFKGKVEEVAKYIKKENEISSAIMFIPSEDIFAFVYAEFQEDVIKFALNKKVWITSPTTLSSILFVLDKHIQDTKFNQNLEVIQKNLLNIKEEFDRWIDRWEAFKKDLNKMNGDVHQLDITHKKINTRYQAIYKDQKLETDQIDVQVPQENEIPNYN